MDQPRCNYFPEAKQRVQTMSGKVMRIYIGPFTVGGPGRGRKQREPEKVRKRSELGGPYVIEWQIAGPRAPGNFGERGFLWKAISGGRS